MGSHVDSHGYAGRMVPHTYDSYNSSWQFFMRPMRNNAERCQTDERD